MESYASLQDTVSVLERLGFQRVKEGSFFFDSPKSDAFGSIVQVYVYQCRNRYWCVDLDGNWLAPLVWTGPKAVWDTTNQTAEFIAFLDKEFPGWR